MPRTFAARGSLCSLAHTGGGNPLEVVWEALTCLLLKTAPTEGLQERSSSCWTCIAFHCYFLFLMFRSVHVLPILVICHCVFHSCICGVCPLCQTALGYLLRKLLHPFGSPHVKLDVLMMGIAEGDQITDGSWDA